MHSLISYVENLPLDPDLQLRSPLADEPQADAANFLSVSADSEHLAVAAEPTIVGPTSEPDEANVRTMFHNFISTREKSDEEFEPANTSD